MSQDPVNPYAAPETVSNPFDFENKVLQPCYSDRRLLNLFIDYFCYVIFAFGIGIVIAMIGGDSAVEAIDQIPSFLFRMIIISIY